MRMGSIDGLGKNHKSCYTDLYMQSEKAVCTVLCSSKKTDRILITSLQKKSRVRCIDELDSELREIYAIRHPESICTGIDHKDVTKFIQTYYADEKRTHPIGCWAWYPWNSTLMRVLPEYMHYELYTSRNRNLITKSEQDAYYGARIGVAGLSVGNAVVASIIHTGGGKYLSIADNDILSGSNINRIRAGFDMVGVSKVELAAREIVCVNPYVQLTRYAQGITRKNIERFLLKPKKLDIIVDEMDSLYLKIQLRLLARKYKIPVVMAADNGDGVVVDIERFDLEPHRPLMHGDVPEKELLAIVSDVSRPVAAKIISTWVRPDNIACRMKTSLLELGKTIYTWPQLGNAAFLAGSVIAYVVRRILTGQSIAQGKFVINPDTFFVPGYEMKQAVHTRKLQTIQFIRQMGMDQ